MAYSFQLPVDPKGPDVAETLSYEARLRVIRTKLETYVGREMTNEDLSDWLRENADNKEELAKLDFDTLEYAAKTEDAWGQAVEFLAAKVAQEGNYGYHPANYKTVGAFLENALQGTSHGSQYKRLKTLTDLVVPFCVKKGIPIPDAAWQPGNRAKFELISDKIPELRAAVAAKEEAPEEAEARIADMLEKAADKDVTLARFKEAYPVSRRRIEMAEAWDYQNGGNRSVLVIELANPVQANRIKELLGHVVNIHMGTGGEPIIKELGRSTNLNG